MTGMRMLRKKAFRDLMQNKSQFLVIFLMVFLGVFAYAGIHAYMDGMNYSGLEYYEKNNLEDIWVSGENFTADDLEKILETENVTGAERQLSVLTMLDGYEDVSLDTVFIESNEISKMFVQDGEGFDPQGGGAWLDYMLAKNLGISVGDSITLRYQTYTLEETVRGLVGTPDHVYSIKDDSAIFPTHKDYGFVYLSAEEFPTEAVMGEIKKEAAAQFPLMKEEMITEEVLRMFVPDLAEQNFRIFPAVLVTIEDKDRLEETKAALENNVKSALAVTDRKASVSWAGYQSEVEEGETYAGVFTFLFLFIALISVVTTMNRFVRRQRTQIGTLKALGIRRSKIMRHYVSFGLIISVIAAILGLILGVLILGNFFLNMEMSYFENPMGHWVIIPQVYLMSVLIVAAVVLVTYLSCRRILKEPTSEALRVERPVIKKSNFRFSSRGFLRNTSLAVRWNLRDISRNVGRTLMAAVGIIGCTMLIVCALGMLDTMNSYFDWQFDKIYHFQYKLSLETSLTEERMSELEETYGKETSQTLGIEIQMPDGSKKANVLTVNDAPGMLRITGHNKQLTDFNDDGIFITEKLGGTLGLSVGDEITWHVFGDEEWHTTTISGTNRDPQNQQLNITRAAFENLGFSYKADTIYTDEDLSGTESIEGVSSIQSISNLSESMANMLQTMKAMIVLIIGVSVILGVVIIYNMGILSFSEKQYQFSTMKVLGFKNRQIRSIFVKQNIWISAVSILIGLPLGYLMTSYIFSSALGESYDFPADIRGITYVLSALGTALVSYVVNRFLSGKVKTIDMVASLKANE